MSARATPPGGSWYERAAGPSIDARQGDYGEGALLDDLARRLAEPLLGPLASRMSARGMRAETLAGLALVAGLAAALAVVLAKAVAALALALAWSLLLAIGRAGPAAAPRADLVLALARLVVLGALPLAFALRAPDHGIAAAGLAAAMLLRAGVPDAPEGQRIGAGLAGGVGTTLFLLAMIALPERLPVLALALAGLVVLEALSRFAVAWVLLRPPPEDE